MRTNGLILILLFVLVPILGNCQPGDPGGDPDVPITGIEILLASGGLLGIKKLLSSRKNKS